MASVNDMAREGGKTNKIGARVLGVARKASNCSLNWSIEFLEKNRVCQLIREFWKVFGWLGAAVAMIALLINLQAGRNNAITQSHFQSQIILSQNGDNGISKKEAIELLVRDRISVKGIRLAGEYLPGANLRGAFADEGDFRRANLKRANLSFGSFRGANFSDAHLNSAVLIAFNHPAVDAKGTEIIYCCFDRESARLEYARDENAPVIMEEDVPYQGAIFSRANLSWAKLIDADLAYTPLDGANLSHAELYRAILYGSDLTNADLRDADISDAVFVAENNRNPAKVSQEQISSACVVAGHLPMLPHNMKPPTKICSHEWREGKPPVFNFIVRWKRYIFARYID